ncbi:cobyrinate a,c-diamide synthase [Jiella marina]|uniref:cobyrinate a,c-diamide synthase n=1 Tax=Jiella sp. LLJ827 TaxID=2917712 RepID=UPI002101C24C|nr:cobyrinate a,c-diamide synthase [Jiella sp. LLJ827]MCQ0989622.1 cobyrinate a,c-diamide synthase [Jiella sp. LLJ827]
MAGLMIAAPASGTGKTTVTLALIAALRASGRRVRSAKAGPDYIDPAFHAAASGEPCINLDAFAMRPELLEALGAEQARGADAFIVEAMMGLFDGAADGTGSAADLAARLGLNIALVVDCARQSHSVAALVSGFHSFRADTRVAGLILNRVGSPRHGAMLRNALEPLGIPILAILPRRDELALPERHLGLVQAGEHRDLSAFLETAARWMTENAELDGLAALGAPGSGQESPGVRMLRPLGQRIAIARDAAFAFAYPHMLKGWAEQGAELSFFSPLADEAPTREADAIFLPGGYPELHGGSLAAAGKFKAGMRTAAERGVLIYGECGGYMVLGEELVDAAGEAHAMTGLLPLVTSFAERRLHLGYRRLRPLAGAPFEGELMGHEFHYSVTLREAAEDTGVSSLFAARDALGTDLGVTGLRRGSVMGSFCHVIDRR